MNKKKNIRGKQKKNYKQNYKQRLLERKDEWLDENSYKSQLLNITPMNPLIGSYIQVFDLDISEDFFPIEYRKILEAYDSVLSKLDKHYRKNKK